LKQACKQQEGDILQKILSTEESCKTDQATLNPKTHAKLLHPDRYCSNWGSGSFARKCMCVCEVTRKKRKRQGLLAHLLPIANAMMVEWLRVKKYFPPASTFHGCLSEICTKPASLNLCLASSVATQQQQSPTTTRPPPEAEKNLRHPSFVSKARENPRKIKPKKIRLPKTKPQPPPKPSPEFCGR
jgi:hypothetical protein